MSRLAGAEVVECGVHVLHGEGLGDRGDLVAGAKAQPGDPVYQRAEAAGVKLVKSVGTLAKKSDIILALTPGKSALPALKKIRKYLRPDHLYVDASSNSAHNMEKAENLLVEKELNRL